MPSWAKAGEEICKKVLEEIWINQEMTQGKILGRIGPYSISDSSIRHLRGAFSDEENFNAYDCIFGAVNEGGSHWTLVICHSWKPFQTQTISFQCQTLFQSLATPFKMPDNDFPVPDNDFPVSDIIPELDNAIPESDNTIPESDNAIPQSEESEIIIPESSTKKHIQPVTKKHRIYKGSPQKYSLRNITCNKEKTFVYPKLKLKSEEYCVCNQPDDGSLYIQCEICEKWFHPSCLPSPIDLEDKDLNNSNKITDYSGSLADAEFNKLLMFLMTIMKCSDDYCEEVDHVAHHTFIKKPIQFHRTEMKKAGYGADKFGVQFIEALHDKIQRTIAVTKRKNPRKPYTGGVFLTLRSLP
ncbi:hypothetical protein ScPMuIL_004104 [Solemya velum]